MARAGPRSGGIGDRCGSLRIARLRRHIGGDAILGNDVTSDEAWQDFLARMKIANVEVAMELQTDAGGFPEPDQTLASDYGIIATTKALLDKVERDGGAISWARRNGVACTDEEEAA
jgi:hypothetical protein